MKKITLLVSIIFGLAFSGFASAAPLSKIYIIDANIGIVESGSVVSGHTTVASGASPLILSGDNGKARGDNVTVLNTGAFENNNWVFEVSAATPSQAAQALSNNYSDVSFSVRARVYNDPNNRTSAKTYPIMSNMPLTSGNSVQQVAFTLPWSRYKEFLLYTHDTPLDGFNASITGNIPDNGFAIDRVYSIDLSAQSGMEMASGATGSGVSHIGTVNLNEFDSPGYISFKLGTVLFGASSHNAGGTGKPTGTPSGVTVTVYTINLDEDSNMTSAEIEALADLNIGALSKVSDFVLSGDTPHAVNVYPTSTRGKIAWLMISSVTNVYTSPLDPPSIEFIKP